MTASTDVWPGHDVWAPSIEVEGNRVSQLVIPAGELKLVQAGSGFVACNQFGSWPTYREGEAAPDGIALRLSAAAAATGPVRQGEWTGQPELNDPSEVLASLAGRLSYERERPGGPPALRQPQQGALHSVLGYWTTGRSQPATVVMPTGTGKTETMLALLVAAQLPRLLVLVPSDALREQVSGKFERLWVLQQLGIVGPDAVRPVVGRLQHGLASTATAQAFVERCNVIVATPASLHACREEAKALLLGSCSHLFVDEAHHQPATTWQDVLDAFTDKPVVQFTATPFREDGRHLGGRIVYNFPLRMAQEQGYFAPVAYHSVLEFEDTDRVLAQRAVAQLRQDIADDRDHLLMVRVSSVGRMHEILPFYQEVAADLDPVLINSGMSKRSQREALSKMRSRQSRIIICVNMLGEGLTCPH